MIGFYQVTHGLLQAFSYIKWPDSLQVIAKYSGILQMDLLQIAPMGCLVTRLQVNAFVSLLAIMAINAPVIGVSVGVYGVRKIIILLNRNLQNDVKSRSISEIKELVFRNLFSFLYATYLSTCAQTARDFAIACQTLCRDDREEMCLRYMKADDSIKCQGTNYNYWLIYNGVYLYSLLRCPSGLLIYCSLEEAKSSGSYNGQRRTSVFGLRHGSDLCIAFSL